MYRMRIHKLPVDGDYDKYRIITKDGSYKMVAGKRTGSRDNDYKVLLFDLYQSGKELVRDLLFKRHGDDWRKFEQPRMVDDSIRSAVKRARFS